MCANFISKDFSFPWNSPHTDGNTLEKTCTPALTVPRNLPLTKSCWSTRRHIRILCTPVHTVRTFNIRCSMDQHVRGTHGLGWGTPCGKTVDWPRKLSSHKRHCEIVKLYYCRENVMPLIWKLRLQQKTIDCVRVIRPHTLD